MILKKKKHLGHSPYLKSKPRNHSRPVKILSPHITMAFTNPLFELNPENSFMFFRTLMFLLSEPVYNKSADIAKEYM